MLKLPKGLKKKKKGKKSKKGKDEELFTEAELEKYKREHQQQEAGEPSVKENEEWSKFKNLTSGIDSVLKKTQGDLDRIKTTSFFQRVPVGPKEVEKKEKKSESIRPVVEVTEADFPQIAQADEDADKSEYGATDDESEEDDQDDIFDTSYVEAVERGDVKLTYVPDSPEECQDDDIFDTSHVDVLIKGKEVKNTGGKNALDIGIAVSVLTGRIDNVTLTTTKRPKRVIPGDLLLEDDQDTPQIKVLTEVEPVEKSILDTEEDIPISSPIDLSVSLHTVLLQQNAKSQEDLNEQNIFILATAADEEDDEFTQLAAESLESSSAVTKLEEKEIVLEPVLQESWSAFEADKNDSVFAECIVEDQIDILDPYLGEDDPFDTSFAEAVIPVQQFIPNAAILEDDDDFDPRAEEVQPRLNNRRKSSVRIHLTDPSGVRESISSDDVIKNTVETSFTRDLLGGSSTDLTQLADSPLDPIDLIVDDIDPFDTSIVDKVVAPGRVELKILEQELIGSTPTPIYRVPSDPDFDPRAEEPAIIERRPSRPENLIVSKSVGFDVNGSQSSELDVKNKFGKPLTPYYSRELSITEDKEEETEASDTVSATLIRTRSDEDISAKVNIATKRRHSEFSNTTQTNLNTKNFLGSGQSYRQAKVLTPSGPPTISEDQQEIDDPFDTTFASNIAPCKTELKLLAKEFSCEDTKSGGENEGQIDLLEPHDDIFQIKALTPEPTARSQILEQDFDPFDTSFAGDLNPGRTEIKLLESEFLN